MAMSADVKNIYLTLLKDKGMGKLREIKRLYGDWLGLMYDNDSCHAVRPFLSIDGDSISLARKHSDKR